MPGCRGSGGQVEIVDEPGLDVVPGLPDLFELLFPGAGGFFRVGKGPVLPFPDTGKYRAVVISFPVADRDDMGKQFP